MVWWHFFAAVLAILMCAYKWKKLQFREMNKLSKIEYAELPIIGHGHCLIGNSEDRMTAFQKMGRSAIKHGGVSSAWMIHHFYIMVADPVVAEFILKTCLEKGFATKLLKFVLGNGSLIAPVSIWRPRRKIVAPTFSSKNLAQFVKIFSKQSSVMIEQLRCVSGKGPFSLWSYLTTYTMDSVCESTLGVQVNSQKNPDQPFLKAFEVFCKLTTSRVCSPWLYSDTLYKILPPFRKLTKAKEFMCSFIEQIIETQRKFNEEQCVKEVKKNESSQIPVEKEKLKTFLELLIESSGGDKGCTNVELQEETLVMVMAGTDTSAVGAAFTTVMLSKYPEVQEKIYEELIEVFGDKSRPVENDDLHRLKYLEAVIKESLRLYPPVPVILRFIDKDITLSSGQRFLAGTNAVISIWGIHRNPLYWGPDAEEFRPERFLNPEFKHPAQFMPFSYGPRSCIGYQYAMMSMKTVLSTLLRHYRVLPLATNGDSMSGQHQPLKVRFDIMMKDVDNFIVELEPRA